MAQNSIVLPTVGTVSGLTMTQDTNAAISSLATNFSGTSAPASSGTLPAQFWYNTSSHTLNILSEDSTTWIQLFSTNQASYTAIASGVSIAANPGGRLTLTSSAAVMTADTNSSGSIYYVPYISNVIPIIASSGVVNNTFSALTMTLSSGVHSSGSLYDLFVFLNGSTPTIGSAAAWTSTSSRSSGIGITQSSGIWVNASSITLKNSSSTYTVSSTLATYVGTFYTTGLAQTSQQFKPSTSSGGSNAILGLYNAYNRVMTTSMSRDTNSNWTYGTATWRSADNNNNNRVSFVDGLQQSEVDSLYYVGASVSSGQAAYIGLNLNSTSSQPNITATTAIAGSQSTIAVNESFSAVLGFSYIQAMEYSTGSSSTFYGDINSQPTQALKIKISI